MINWKVRFRNKLFVTEFCAMVVTFVYSVLGAFDIAPSITQNTVMQIINSALLVLSTLGVVVDPTTVGISDSNRAMTYDEPYDDDNPPNAKEENE